MTRKNEPITLTAKQVSERYGVSMGTLANWRYQKTGPQYYKKGGLGKGGMIFYRTTDVESYLLSTPIVTNDSR